MKLKIWKFKIQWKLKIDNWKLFLLLFVLLLYGNTVEAGTIINRPLAIGLNIS